MLLLLLLPLLPDEAPAPMALRRQCSLARQRDRVERDAALRMHGVFTDGGPTKSVQHGGSFSLQDGFIHKYPLLVTPPAHLKVKRTGKRPV